MTDINLPDSWKKTTLGEISQNVMYGLNSKATDFDGNRKYIRITDINDDTNKFCPSPLTSPDGVVDEKYKLIKGDLLFARTGATVGKSYLYDENDGNLYFAGFLIRFNIVNHDARFIFIQTQTLQYWNWVKSISMRSGQPGINAEEYKSLPIVIPPIKLQKAIANTIQTWDTAIEKTEALIAAKEHHFAWLVQTLIGDKQYNDGWHETSLGEIFEVHIHSSKSPYINAEGNFYIVDMGAISRHGDLVVSKRSNCREDFLRAGELVMPKDDIGGGNIIGKVALIDQGNKYICGDHVYKLVLKENHSPSFLRFAINSKPINKSLRAKSSGTSQLGLGKKDVLKQPIWTPDFSFQEKISTILDTAQQEINLLKELSEQYRSQKRYLMQKLLTPN